MKSVRKPAAWAPASLSCRDIILARRRRRLPARGWRLRRSHRPLRRPKPVGASSCGSRRVAANPPGVPDRTRLRGWNLRSQLRGPHLHRGRWSPARTSLPCPVRRRLQSMPASLLLLSSPFPFSDPMILCSPVWPPLSVYSLKSFNDMPIKLNIYADVSVLQK